ncbi:hypothetical protein [Actinomyces howellii]|uniref:Uncharacterized protein n=1 Tax=Actinomyces howellii TaxID=52771 RepID=A0A3S4V505_9ACTO|nr:hypothetical protein [Actinomyces howellii]VEG28530.1 Uncharacterised protein [Actinomyces howellii]
MMRLAKDLNAQQLWTIAADAAHRDADLLDEIVDHPATYRALSDWAVAALGEEDLTAVAPPPAPDPEPEQRRNGLRLPSMSRSRKKRDEPASGQAAAPNATGIGSGTQGTDSQTGFEEPETPQGLEAPQTQESAPRARTWPEPLEPGLPPSVAPQHSDAPASSSGPSHPGPVGYPARSMSPHEAASSSAAGTMQIPVRPVARPTGFGDAAAHPEQGGSPWSAGTASPLTGAAAPLADGGVNAWLAAGTAVSTERSPDIPTQHGELMAHAPRETRRGPRSTVSGWLRRPAPLGLVLVLVVVEVLTLLALGVVATRDQSAVVQPTATPSVTSTATPTATGTATSEVTP